MSSGTPVTLIVYNRPECTNAVIEALSAVRPKTMFVIADGPREDIHGDVARCAEVRSLVRDISWQCEIITNFSDVNLGCRERCISGLNWVFSQSESSIILEDDTVPDPSFFPFCEELLERYRKDKWIQLIRGHSGISDKLNTTQSYYFSQWQSTWGWATWSRSWNLLDMQMKAWPEMRRRKWLQSILSNREMVRVFDHLFQGSYSGAIKDWGNQWFFSGWLNNSVSIAPTKNLITNIGFGTEATHLKNSSDPNANLSTSPIHFPLVHPEERVIWEAADSKEWEMAYIGLRRRLRFRSRLKQKLLKLLGTN